MDINPGNRKDYNPLNGLNNIFMAIASKTDILFIYYLYINNNCELKVFFLFVTDNMKVVKGHILQSQKK